MIPLLRFFWVKESDEKVILVLRGQLYPPRSLKGRICLKWCMLNNFSLQDQKVQTKDKFNGYNIILQALPLLNMVLQ